MIVVVGSGPAGVACAHALASRGVPVTIVDVGLELEPERAEVVSRLAAQDHRSWSPDAVSRLNFTAPREGGFIQKLAFGSDFPYRPADPALDTRFDGVALRPSFARGGLSTVWGGAILPYSEEDTRGWPISSRDLAPHYGEALGMMEVSVPRDDLSETFPMDAGSGDELDASPQGGWMLDRLKARRHRLLGRGITFGKARLAVRAGETRRGTGCRYCGTCLSGCPYGLIYSASQTIDLLRERFGVAYRAGIMVHRLEQVGSSVRLHARSVEGGTLSIDADRVYLAAGPVGSLRIMLASLEAWDQPVTIRDSQYFLLPMVQTSAPRGGHRLPSHTLSQIFLEVQDPSISQHRVHLQAYGYNDLFRAEVDRALGPVAKIAGAGADWVLDRLMAVQGYLHSDDSSSITAVLTRPTAGRTTGELLLEKKLSPTAGPTVRRVARKLARAAIDLGAVPVLPMLEIGEPGRGFHSGGALPMMERPTGFATDLLGRPVGFDSVHIVDASVFPTIPAGPITLSVMANAIRIGSESEA